MKLIFHFLLLLLLARGSIYAQTDTMVVDLGSTVQKYLVSDISQITFKIDATGVNEEELGRMNEILNSFALHQNYPNPFNPSTNIAYRLPERGNVCVRIYDVNGEFIKEIISASQEAGEHTITWDSKSKDGSVVSSGVYFYQVQWNNTVLTKKMIYLK